MNGWAGAIELVGVFGLVLAWGFWELHKLRAYKDKQNREPPPGA